MNPGEVVALFIAIAIGYVFGTASLAIAGVAFLLAGGIAAAMAAGRVLRSGSIEPMGGWGLGLVGCLFLGLTWGHLHARDVAEVELRAAADRQKAVEVERRRQLAVVPDLEAQALSVEASTKAEQLGAARSAYEGLSTKSRALRALPPPVEPELQKLLAHIDAAHAALVASEAQVAIEVEKAAVALTTGTLATRASRLAAARATLNALEAPGAPAVVAAKDELDAARHALVDGLGTFGQPAQVVLEKLLGQAAPYGSDALQLSGYGDGLAFALLQKDVCTSMYLSRKKESASSLDATTVANFLVSAIGPTAQGAKLSPPAGNGARQWSGVVGGARVHAGWMNAALVEVWVGDFAP